MIKLILYIVACCSVWQEAATSAGLCGPTTDFADDEYCQDSARGAGHPASACGDTVRFAGSARPLPLAVHGRHRPNEEA